MPTARPSRRPAAWVVPLFAVAAGAVLFIATWIAGNPGIGVGMFLIMAGYGALLLIGGRSQTIRLLRGQPSDERYQLIDLRSTALAGTVTIFALVVCFAVELARGHSGNPYGLLLALAGLSYIAGLLLFRR